MRHDARWDSTLTLPSGCVPMERADGTTAQRHRQDGIAALAPFGRAQQAQDHACVTGHEPQPTHARAELGWQSPCAKYCYSSLRCSLGVGPVRSVGVSVAVLDCTVSRRWSMNDMLPVNIASQNSIRVSIT